MSLLEEARLVLDVVFVVPLPPGSLQVLNTLLLRGSHFQVALFQIPEPCKPERISELAGLPAAADDRNVTHTSDSLSRTF